MNQSRRLRSRGRILALASALLLLSPLTANVAKAVSYYTPGPDQFHLACTDGCNYSAGGD